MKLFTIHKKVYFKAIAMAVLCLFLVNNVSWASGGNIKGSFQNLQVQSIYAPITDVLGRTFEKEIKTETAIILSSVLRDPETPFQDINAAIDEWYGVLDRQENPRVLNVIRNPKVGSDGKVNVVFEFFDPTKDRKIFRMTSGVRSLLDINDPLSDVLIEEIDPEEGIVRSSSDLADPIREKAKQKLSETLNDELYVEGIEETDDDDETSSESGPASKMLSGISVPLLGEFSSSEKILLSIVGIGGILIFICVFILYKIGGFAIAKEMISDFKRWLVAKPLIRDNLRKIRKWMIERRAKVNTDAKGTPGKGLDETWLEEELISCAPLDNVDRRVVAVGDVHGALGGLRDILEGAGIIEKGNDPDGLEDKWIGGNAILLQGGDVIDRGDKSLESLKYLRYLRVKAHENHGEVVRLMGNHELCYLLKNAGGNWKGQIERLKNMRRDEEHPEMGYVIQGFSEELWENSDEFIDMLKEDVLNGAMVAAYELGGKLFTHGIVTRDLVDDMQKRTWKDLSITEEFVQEANNVLVSAVKKNRFDHEIFSLGYGIVQTKAHGITALYMADLFKQYIHQRYSDFPFDSVVFHDYSIFSATEFIPAKVMSNGKTVTCADVGMTDYYGGGRGALVFEGGKSKAAYPKWGRKIYDSYIDRTKPSSKQEPYTGPDKVLVVVGPSGAGKSTFLENITAANKDKFEAPPVFTTRKQREGETYDGSKVFVSKKTFMTLKDEGKFSMVRHRHGHWYGVFNPDLDDIKKKDKIIQFDTSSLDSLNAIRRLFPNAYVVFVSPVSAQELGIEETESLEASSVALEKFARKHPEMLKARLQERILKRGGMPESEMETRLEEAVELVLETPNTDPDLIIYNAEEDDIDVNFMLFESALNDSFGIYENLVFNEVKANDINEIGKLIEVNSIYEDKGKWFFNYQVNDKDDERGSIRSILTRRMELVEGYDLAGIIEGLEFSKQDDRFMRAFIDAVRKEQEKIKVFEYDTHRPIGDLYAFADERNSIITFWKHIKDDPVAVFHEAAEYLIAKGHMKLIYANGQMYVFINGKSIGEPKVVRPPQAVSGEVRSKSHYLLRALQEKLFPHEDLMLSGAIEDRTDRPKKRVKLSDADTTPIRKNVLKSIEWGLYPVKGIVPLKETDKTVFTVGDIHGDLDAFRDILEGLDLIKKGSDRFGLEDEWIAEEAVLVQGGDVIDRGPHPIEALKYLRYLQKEAKRSGGKVVRLLGNHELFYLLRHSDDKFWSGKIEELYEKKQIRGIDPALWKDDDELLSILREDIKSGDIVGTYQIGGKVFTHGALKSRFLEVLFKNTDNKTKDPKIFETVINAILRKAVKTNEFNNLVFAIRGDTLGGITATYFSVANNDFDVAMMPFDLVCFHDPSAFDQAGIISYKKGRFSDRTLACVDVGMTAKMGGGRAALVFEGDAVYEAYPFGEDFVIEAAPYDVDPNAETGRYENTSQIGKRSTASIVLNDSGEKHIKVSYRSEGGGFSSSSIELFPYSSSKAMMAFRSLRAKPIFFQRMMREFEVLLNKAPPEFYYFKNLYNDLFGKAAPKTSQMPGTIALHESISENPVAVFHEVSEYLLRSGLINIEMHKNKKKVIITSANPKVHPFIIDISTHTRHRIKNIEKWDPSWKRDPHYLLRAVQLELFGNDIPLGGGEQNMQDLALTSFIKDKQAQAALRSDDAEGIAGPFVAKGSSFYATRFDDRDAMRKALDRWFAQETEEDEHYLGRFRWDLSIDRARDSRNPLFMVKLEAEDGRILGLALCAKKMQRFIEYEKDAWELELMEVDSSIRGAGLGHIMLGKILEYVLEDLEKDIDELERTDYISEEDAEHVERRILLTHPAEDEEEREEKGGHSAKDFYYGEGFRDVPITWTPHIGDDQERDLFLSISKEFALRIVADVKSREKPRDIVVSSSEPRQLNLFDDLEPGSLSWVGEKLIKWYSPLFHAPIFEEVAKVGAPFLVYAILNNFIEMPGLAAGVLAALLVAFGIGFVLLHSYNERGPPQERGRTTELLKVYTAPSLAAVAGIIISLVNISSPQTAIIGAVAAHFVINLVIKLLKYLKLIDVRYASIKVNYTYRPNRDITEHVAEKRAAVEVQKNISRMMASLSSLRLDYVTSTNDAEKEKVLDERELLVDMMRKIVADLPAKIEGTGEYRKYSDLLKNLKSERNKLYRKIEKAALEKDRRSLKRMNIAAVNINHRILKLQLIVAGMMLSGKSPVRSMQGAWNSAMLTLDGSLYTSRSLEEELGYRISRLRARDKIREIETKDWAGEAVKSYKMGTLDVSLTDSANEDTEPTVKIGQNVWINVHNVLERVRRAAKRGDKGQAMEDINKLLGLYSLRYVRTRTSYKGIENDLKEIRASINALPEIDESWAFAIERAKAASKDIKQAKSTIVKDRDRKLAVITDETKKKLESSDTPQERKQIRAEAKEAKEIVKTDAETLKTELRVMAEEAFAARDAAKAAKKAREKAVKALTGKITALTGKIDQPKQKIRTFVEFSGGHEKAFRGQIKAIASCENDYATVLKNQADLVHYIGRLEDAIKRGGHLSIRNKDIITAGLENIHAWLDRGYVNPKQFASIDMAPARGALDKIISAKSELNSDNLKTAVAYLKNANRDLDKRLPEIDANIKRKKELAQSQFEAIRDKQIKKAADEVWNSIELRDHEGALDVLRTVRARFMTDRLEEPGYVRVDNIFGMVEAFIEQAKEYDEPSKIHAVIRRGLDILKQDVDHKFSYRFRLTTEHGEKKNIYSSPGISVKGLLRQLRCDTSKVDVFVEGKRIMPSELLRTKIEDKSNVLIRKKSRYRGQIGKYYEKIRTSGIGDSGLHVAGLKRDSLLEESFDLKVANGDFDVLGLRKMVDPYYVVLLYKLIKQFDGRVCIYEESVKDLLGFADRSEKIVAVQNEIYGNPLAVFHEILEYLMDNEGLPEELYNSIKYDEESGRIQIFVENQVLLTRPILGTISEMVSSGEEWAAWPVEVLNDKTNTHYLIRILQREMFGEHDKEFTEKIREALIRIKKGSSRFISKRFVFEDKKEEEDPALLKEQEDTVGYDEVPARSKEKEETSDVKDVFEFPEWMDDDVVVAPESDKDKLTGSMEEGSSAHAEVPSPKKETRARVKKFSDFDQHQTKDEQDEIDTDRIEKKGSDIPEHILSHLAGLTVRNFAVYEFPVTIDRFSDGDVCIYEDPALIVSDEVSGKIVHNPLEELGHSTRIPVGMGLSDETIQQIQRNYYRASIYLMLAKKAATPAERARLVESAVKTKDASDRKLKDLGLKADDDIVHANAFFLYMTREDARSKFATTTVTIGSDGFIAGWDEKFELNARGRIIGNDSGFTLKLDEELKYSKPAKDAHINFREAVKYVNRIKPDDKIVAANIERLKGIAKRFREAAEATIAIRAGEAQSFLQQEVLVRFTGEIALNEKKRAWNNEVTLTLDENLEFNIPSGAHENLVRAIRDYNAGKHNKKRRIGKRASAGQVFIRDGKIYVHVVDPENEKNVFGELELSKVPARDAISSYEKMHVLADDRSSRVIDVFGQLFLDSGAVLYSFTDKENIAKDLFGFASPEDKIIALDSSLLGSGAALFHEIGEYLVGLRSGRAKKGLVDLSISKKGKKVKMAIKIKSRESSTAKLKPLDEIELSEYTLRYIKGEAWEKGWEKDPHYLLRILQRELFETHDLTLSLSIGNAQKMKLSEVKADDDKIDLNQREVQAFAVSKVNVPVRFRKTAKEFIAKIKQRDITAMEGFGGGVNMLQLGHSRNTFEKMVYCMVAAASKRGEVKDAAKILASKRPLEHMGYELTPDIVMAYKLLRISDKGAFRTLRRDLTDEAWPDEDKGYALTIMATELARLFDFTLIEMVEEPAGMDSYIEEFVADEEDLVPDDERIQLKGALGKDERAKELTALFEGPVNIYAGDYGYEISVSDHEVIVRRFNVEKGNYSGRAHVFPIGKSINIGRSKSHNNYIIGDPSLSKEHFSVTVKEENGSHTITIIDKDSTNGTRYELVSLKKRKPDEDKPEVKKVKMSPELEKMLAENKAELPGIEAGPEQMGKRVIFENPDRLEKSTQDIIRKTDRSSQRALRAIKSFMKEHTEDALLKGKKATPVDIVVDLSLISKTDLEENVETWAYLMLMCRNIKNVNFLFEFPDLAGDGKVPAGLSEDYANVVSRIELIMALENEVRDKAFIVGMNESETELFIFERMGAPKREDAVEIILMNIPDKALEEQNWKKWEIWRKNVELAPNQYPVALRGATHRKDHGILLRNFEAGLTLGLAKASLAIAKKADSEKEKDEEKDLPKLRKTLLIRLQSLFDALPFEKEIELTEETLNSMVSDFSVERFNLAMDLALPPVIRMPIEYLRDFHEGIQLALQAA